MLNFLLTQTPLVYFMQPFWRDEAYSALFGSLPIAKIIAAASPEPPLYYSMLHVWMQLVGNSEIAIRAFSLLGFAVAGIAVIYLSEQLFEKHIASWVTPVLFFLNPFFLYYAFEARAYGWYMAFAILSISAYLRKSWKQFILFSVLGIYTHLYMVFVPFVCAIHYLVIHTNELSIKKIFSSPVVRSILLIFVASLPMLTRIALIMPQFKNSWYYSVDWHLIRSVLGNMFTGYEGTPWFLWTPMIYVSIALLLMFGVAFISKKRREYTSFFLLLVFVPLVVILTISQIKPLYVNRYLLPVVFGELFLLGYAITGLRQRWMQYLFSVLFIGSSLGFNLWYPAEHLKMDYRTPMKEINSLATPEDVIFADDPIHLFETTYYAKNRASVYLYNPTGAIFPWYIGDAIVDKTHIVAGYPPYPTRAFVLHKDGTYTIEYSLPLTSLQKK